jgi:riboflavin transporter FmnP
LGNKTKLFTVNYIAKTGILGVGAWIVMLLEFALPFIFPDFLKLDFSDAVPLIGAFAMGPIAGILIQLIKNSLHLIMSATSGVGELANFIVGSAFVGAAGLYYKSNKTKKGALASLLIGIASMVVAGALVNYFITIPLYSILIVPLEVIIGMSSKVIPAIHNKQTLVLYAFCPFNLLKGVILALFTWPIYKKLSPVLHRGL